MSLHSLLWVQQLRRSAEFWRHLFHEQIDVALCYFVGRRSDAKLQDDPTYASILDRGKALGDRRGRAADEAMRYDVPCGRWCGTGFPRLRHTHAALGENARAHLAALLALRREQRNANTQSLFICLTDEEFPW